jgi:lipopolysaccharide export system protein LptA
MRGEGVEVRGHRARFSASAGVIMMHGNPAGPLRTVLISDRGKISCDQVQIFDADRRVEARGNVQGELRGITILGTESGEQQDTPLNFAAEVLDISEEGSTFRLREQARLWQGHRLLLADDVLYKQQQEVLDASGHVRTTLPSSQIDPQAGAQDDVVVVARSLHFDRPGRQATYDGNVRYSDPQHMMSANQLHIEFDDSNTITSLEATGAVELVDLVNGRRMTGKNARRDLDTQIVRVTGEPVQLMDENGTVISSASLTWNQADGSVKVEGGTETIYYPEDEP